MTDIWSNANQKRQVREDEEFLRYMAIDRSLIDREHEVKKLKEQLFATRLTAVLITLNLLLAIAKLKGWL